MNADEIRTTTEPELSSDAVIVRRPHFQLRGNSLFFLISSRPFASLSQPEKALWNELENEPSVASLRSGLGAGADEAIRRLFELEVAEIVPPAPPGKRRRVMVIEPHMDDAALSVGGAMLQRRAECEFHIVTVATRSIHTSYVTSGREFFDIETVSRLRKAESRLVARLIWGHHISLELVEASLRYNPQNWTRDWFQAHEHSILFSLEHAAGPSELEQWTSAVAKAIADLQPDEIWMPLGVGVHVDHQLIRHALLNVLRANPEIVERCVCRFFQDVPYAADHPAHTGALLNTLTEAGAKLEEERTDITAVMPEKRRLLSIFGSQWKSPVIQARVEACAGALGGPPGSYRELSYRAAVAPTRDIDMVDTFAMKDSVYRVAREGARWAHRNRHAPVIRILLALTAGRWEQDMQFLLDYFPDSRFEVHMQTKFAAEAGRFTSPRISVLSGGNRLRWLLGDALTTVVGGRGPLVIIPGRQMERFGWLLARFGVLSDPLVAPTMSDLVSGLQYAAKYGEECF